MRLLVNDRKDEIMKYVNSKWIEKSGASLFIDDFNMKCSGISNADGKFKLSSFPCGEKHYSYCEFIKDEVVEETCKYNFAYRSFLTLFF